MKINEVDMKKPEARDMMNKYKYQESLTNEAADMIYADGIHTKYNEGITYPFIINGRELTIYKGGLYGIHGNILKKYEIDDDDGLESYNDWIFHGRIFAGQKILAFWKQPTKKQLPLFLTLIKDTFEDELDITSWKDWRIEVYNGNDKKGWSYNNPKDYEYVSVKDYIGSENVPDEVYQQHLLSPMNKTKKKNLVGNQRNTNTNYQVKMKLKQEIE